MTQVIQFDERRPWRTFSFQGDQSEGGMRGMYTLVDMLLADRMDTLRFWVNAAARDAQALCKADAVAQELLKEST